MPTDEIKDVPAEEMGEQVQQLVDSAGVNSIKCVPQTSGSWTITVTYS